MVRVVRIPGTVDRYVARVEGGDRWLNGLGQTVRFPESMTLEQALAAKVRSNG
jgi:hypothetical protein